MRGMRIKTTAANYRKLERSFCAEMRRDFPNAQTEKEILAALKASRYWRKLRAAWVREA